MVLTHSFRWADGDGLEMKVANIYAKYWFVIDADHNCIAYISQYQTIQPTNSDDYIIFHIQTFLFIENTKLTHVFLFHSVICSC